MWRFSKAIRENKIGNFDSFSKEGLMNAYDVISPIIEKYRYKVSKQRYVDFNQGTD